MEPLLRLAREAGLEDSIVLDHVGEPGLDDCKDFEEYISRLEASLDAEPRFLGRPVAIFAHSHGCVGAYGLARRLGVRCLKLYAAGRRPPDAGLLDEVWGVDCGSKLDSVSDEALLKGMLNAWPNDMLERFRSVRPLPEPIKETLRVVRRQYGAPALPLGSAGAPLLARQGGCGGEALAFAAPLMAVAAAGEAAAGETAEKMAGWRDFSAGGFELRTLEGTHMGLAEAQSELFQLVVGDILEAAFPSTADAAGT